MDRSQGKFNKIEKEKKKQKKRVEKERKKEERKLNSETGKGGDEMFAYVDEFGNISSTAPDPSKKRIINVEDIQLGAARRDDLAPEELIRTGTVTFFNDSKGYGFIKDHVSQESIFVHVNGLLEPVKENDKVTFETERSRKGLNAFKVKLVV